MPIILKSISGTDMKFQIAYSGRVKYWNGNTFEILPLYKKKSGHVLVDLEVGNQTLTKRVDKLVLHHFIKPQPSKKHKDVIHLDGNKENCEDKNLQWATKKEAKRYYKEFALRPKKGKKGRGVKVIDTKAKKESTYPSPKDAEKATGIRAGKIRAAIRSKQNINDFTFEYLP